MLAINKLIFVLLKKRKIKKFLLSKKGKPLKESLIEIDSSAKAYEWFGEEAKRSYGDLIPATTVNKRFLVIKQPVGVCAFITPVNCSLIKNMYLIL